MNARLLSCLALALAASAQPSSQWNLASISGFEYGLPGVAPPGWSVSSDGAVVTDCNVAHSGNCSAQISRTSSTNSQDSYVVLDISAPSSGASLIFSGWVAIQNITGSAFLYVSEYDGNGDVITYATSHLIAGTMAWQQYSISLSLSGQGPWCMPD